MNMQSGNGFPVTTVQPVFEAQTGRTQSPAPPVRPSSRQPPITSVSAFDPTAIDRFAPAQVQRPGAAGDPEAAPDFGGVLAIDRHGVVRRRAAEVHAPVDGAGLAVGVAAGIDHQGLAFLLADMEAAVASARATYLHAARLRDAGRPFSREASVAKLVATDNAMKVTTDAVQVLGGAGYTKDFPVERYMRETKVMQIFEGTNQIQRLVIGRSLARS